MTPLWQLPLSARAWTKPACWTPASCRPPWAPDVTLNCRSLSSSRSPWSGQWTSPTPPASSGTTPPGRSLWSTFSVGGFSLPFYLWFTFSLEGIWFPFFFSVAFSPFSLIWVFVALFFFIFIFWGRERVVCFRVALYLCSLFHCLSFRMPFLRQIVYCENGGIRMK